MPAIHDFTSVVLGATVAAGGTFTIAYPAGKAADDFIGGTDHQIHTHSGQTLFAANGDFRLSLGATQITVTLAVGRAMAQGTRVFLHLDRSATEAAELELLAENVTPLRVYRVTLGQPAAASANAIVASQNATLAAGLATGINGALASGGIATLDRPRNVVAAWTGAAVLTVTGTDQFGAPMRESSASGVSFTGRKAFKTITGVSVSANVTGLTVGTGNALGLPFFLAASFELENQIVDDALVGAGTVQVGDAATATATTGDVRGTYTPASAPNGTALHELLVRSRTGTSRGVAQF